MEETNCVSQSLGMLDLIIKYLSGLPRIVYIELYLSTSLVSMQWIQQKERVGFKSQK